MENNIEKSEEQVSIIKNERLENIIKLNNSANKSLKRLADYSKSLGGKKTPIDCLSNKNKLVNAFYDKVASPSRGKIKEVIKDIYDDIKDLSDHTNEAVQLQGDCIVGLSDIIKTIILIESDLYRILRDTNVNNAESFDAIKNYVSQDTETNEIFEVLLTQVYDNVLTERKEKDSIYKRFEQIESEQESIRNQIKKITPLDGCMFDSILESESSKPIETVNKRYVICAAIITTVISTGISIVAHYLIL